MNWSAPEVFVCPANSTCLPAAELLAKTFGLSVHNSQPPSSDLTSWTLLVEPDQLTLTRPDGLSTNIDFVRGKAAQRSQETNFKSQPLARALGLQKLRKRNPMPPKIIDATAGFGTDGWMMASLDCNVRLLEASPILSAMLTHALSVASREPTHLQTSNKLRVINTNAVEYLTNALNERADIIYLDPMYPQTRGNALVKKGMQLLHDLIGPDNNGAQLLDAAVSKADYRVVVKRPRGAPQLEGSGNWSGQITEVQSPHTRFDIYHMASLLE